MVTRLKFVQTVWQDMLLRGGAEKLFPELRVVEATPNLVRVEVQVLPEHLNRLSSVHGGVVSTLVDIGGSLAVSSRGHFMTGVTTDLSTTFISAVGKQGDKLQLDCVLDKLGRNMAFTRVDIYRVTGDGSRLVARGNHTKYIAGSLSHERDVKNGWSED